MLQASEISSQKTWDTFVSTHNPAAFFQSWNWGLVQERLGYRIKRIGLFSGKTLTGLALVVKVSARRGTFLHIRHGPVFDTNTQSGFRDFTTIARAMAKQENAVFVRVSPRIVLDDSSPIRLNELGYREAPIHAMDGEICWMLDLSPTEDTLLSNMRKTTRYEIRKAERFGVSISVAGNAQDLKDFFTLYTSTYERHGFVPHAGIKEEIEIYRAHNQVQLLVARHEGVPVAAATIVYAGKEAIYRHGASVPSKVPAAYALQWHAIREAKRRGCELYNFWGIAPPDNPKHPWSGITLFKTGFGGSMVRYMHAHDLVLSPLYILPLSLDIFRRMRKGY